MKCYPKMYRVESVQGADDVLDLVCTSNPEDRFQAHPDHFQLGEEICEVEFVIKQRVCVTERGLENCFIAHRGCMAKETQIELTYNSRRNTFLTLVGAVLLLWVFAMYAKGTISKAPVAIAAVIMVVLWLCSETLKPRVVINRIP
jgi:hypothetical protein